ncbi:MAG: MBL fold metallo-hydrolase [Planctomycetes bacterium]|nr:MBL fold metallo-hydrolase [Planctomycetota bacterium]
MAITFRTILSSSSGNCILIQTEETNLLVDCGFRSQMGCKTALKEVLSDISSIDAVIVTHNHGDHINYSALKVLEKNNVPVYVFEGSTDELKYKHYNGYSFAALDLRSFSAGSFEINDLTIEAVEVPHHPGISTFAFVIRHKRPDGECKILVAADFTDGAALTEHLSDADLIYIEANHCLELLRIFPNFNSIYHMNNPATARLLADTLGKRKTPPQAVVLGHLSNQRNEPQKAIDEIKRAFRNKGHEINFPIEVAPKFDPSKEIKIA